jgi:hypothetical protein
MAVYPRVPRKLGFVLGNLAPCHQILFKDKLLIELKDCTAMVTPEIFHTSVCNVAKLIAKGEEIWIKRCDGKPWRKIQFAFKLPINPAVQVLRSTEGTTNLRALNEFFTVEVLTYLQSGMEKGSTVKSDSIVFFNLISDLLELFASRREAK